jgi:hypothetical protein
MIVNDQNTRSHAPGFSLATPGEAVRVALPRLIGKPYWAPAPSAAILWE